ncbi:lysylphosphatidylglycerol synthase transmembrane domain-containing protein [candidate division CSSED10-310 bacterium]|uniref:Lysylphosphatidylglycerol synthase transmembrane domain-containing protein n=1 Tax=candidate division CSSED10-310 bacterium TaxID=2855610 RepID=A0ABV6YZP8_UNCC1
MPPAPHRKFDDIRKATFLASWKPKLKSSQNWIGFIISLIFLVLILKSVERKQFFEVIRNVKYWPILPALLVYFIGVYFRAVRWQILLQPIKDIPLTIQFKIITIGYMANNLLPLRAGEFYRAHLLGKKEDISRSAVFSSIVLERVFDGLAMLFFLAILSLILVAPFPGWVSVVAYFSFSFFLCLFLFFLLIVTSPAKFSSILEVMLKVVPSRFRQSARNLSHNALTGLESLKGWKVIIKVLIISIITWLFEASMYYFLFYSFTFHVEYLGAVLLVTLVNLGIMIPSSPGYVGTFEFFCTHTLAIFSVSETVAFSYSILLHFILFLPITLVGLYHFWSLGLTPEEQNPQFEEQDID